MIACASFLSENARPTYRAIVACLAARTGLEAELLPAMDWNEQHRLLDGGDIQLAFLCGLPYTEKHDRPGEPVVLLAAPVMQAVRYGGQPVYFTDVIVRRDRPWRSMADLRGKSWAYNGSDSNSGYNMPRDYLLAHGETGGFFGRTIASGSHQRSIQMVLDGEVDASGIDSLVLEMETKYRPELAASLRVIEAIGPCPIPPVVASTTLSPQVRDQLRRELLAMHADDEGAAILRAGLIARFVPVEDAYYNPIRQMVRRAHTAGFVELK